jgi:hypothetical protein
MRRKKRGSNDSRRCDVSKKMNAGDAATMVLRVFDLLSGASLSVLVAVRDGITARIDAIIATKAGAPKVSK